MFDDLKHLRWNQDGVNTLSQLEQVPDLRDSMDGLKKENKNIQRALFIIFISLLQQHRDTALLFPSGQQSSNSLDGSRNICLEANFEVPQNETVSLSLIA